MGYSRRSREFGAPGHGAVVREMGTNSMNTSQEKQAGLSFQKVPQPHTCYNVWRARKATEMRFGSPCWARCWDHGGEGCRGSGARGSLLTLNRLGCFPHTHNLRSFLRAQGPSLTLGPGYQAKEAGKPKPGPPLCPPHSRPAQARGI